MEGRGGRIMELVHSHAKLPRKNFSSKTQCYRSAHKTEVNPTAIFYTIEIDEKD